MNIEMKYIGACHLLARLSARIESEYESELIHRALDDCAEAFPDSFTVIETDGGGFALDPISDD